MSGSRYDLDLAQEVLKQLYDLIKEGLPIYAPDVDQAIRLLASDETMKLREIFLDTVFVSSRNKMISPKGRNQKYYIDAIRNNDIVFGIGPAGTGKTYLAMAMALAGFLKKKVKRIILCRPAVEAGEKLGFLPGNLYEKVNPYLRPLYDALHDMIEFEKAHNLVELGSIEVAPLAFMRGRTLNDSFVILDEAQNVTREQMKMFLTRLGNRAKAIITGDITQIDLPPGKPSGLLSAHHILGHIPGISFCYFDEKDVVRHPLVMDIIKAYEKQENYQTPQM